MRLARYAIVVLTIASVFVVTRLRLSRDLSELFPDSLESRTLARITRMFGGGDVGLVLLRGDDASAVERAAEDAELALAGLPTTGDVIARAPMPRDLGAFDPTAAWRWAGPGARERLARAVSDEGMRERLRETRTLLLAPGSGDVADWVRRDPLRLSTIPWTDRVELAAGAASVPGSPFTANGGRARLLVVQPRGNAFESTAAARFTDESEAALHGVRERHERVTIDLTGGHVVARQTEALVRGDMEWSSALSALFSSIVFALIFRRPRALLAVLPPLAAGTLWTTAVAELLYPRLSAIAAAFTAVVIGVGVDTGVHVYGRLLAARREGHPPAEAARIARRESWKPTLGAATAAGFAFGCLALSEIAGMRQLGVLCAGGEVLTALAILAMVPEIGAWLERKEPPPAVRIPFVTAVTATRHRSVVALAIAGAAILAGAFTGAPSIDHGVVAPFGQQIPAMATYDAIYATFGGTRGQLFIASRGPDEETARARSDAVAEAAELLMRRGVIEGFDALAQVSPSVPAQNSRLAARDRLDLPRRRAALERALREEGFAPDAFEPALDAFSRPSTETSLGGPLAGLDWIERRHLAHDAEGALALTFVRLTDDPAKDAEAQAVLRAADPDAVFTGFAVLERSLRATLARDLPRVVGAASIVVLIVLALSLRRASSVALAAVVLVVEVALVLVAAKLCGVRWHAYDALVLPVLLGITLDEALFLLEAERKHARIEDALEEQAPLASTTALTTAAGFGALLVCRFGGLVDIGKVGALGSAIGLTCALVIIPAAVRVFGRPR